jgi:hypothetical protein
MYRGAACDGTAIRHPAPRGNAAQCGNAARRGNAIPWGNAVGPKHSRTQESHCDMECGANASALRNSTPFHAVQCGIAPPRFRAIQCCAAANHHGVGASPVPSIAQFNGFSNINIIASKKYHQHY